MENHAEWVKVYSTTQPHKVEIVRALLTEHDIESMVINKSDSSYPGIIGNIEVYVIDKMEVLAKFIINDSEL
ncbi:MAG: DUF2007 domain-containing protein [Bacteroidetes bacterium]|jgi:hypothetical protein|nr:DUF2007 domain-containing protein [Bacteroidota bacterium]